MFRLPSSSAVSAPEIGDPPDATTPTSANCEAPVNTSRDSAQVWRTDSPAATEMAPKEMP